MKAAIIQRPEASSTRHRIVEAAARILVDQGPNFVNFNTLAQELKTNRAHIRYYFESSTSIILACFENLFVQGQSTTIQQIATAKSISAQVRGYVRGAFDWQNADPQRMTLMLLFFFKLRLHPELKTLHSKYRKAGLDRIAGILRASGLNERESKIRGQLIQNIITGALLSYATTENHSLAELRRQTEIECLRVAKRPV